MNSAAGGEGCASDPWVFFFFFRHTLNVVHFVHKRLKEKSAKQKAMNEKKKNNEEKCKDRITESLKEKERKGFY